MTKLIKELARRRGVTLTETIVALGIFAAVTTMTLVILSLNGKSERKSTAHAESYRTSALILRHLRQEFRGARVLLEQTDGEVATLSYQVPQWQGDRILVDRRGRPIWGAIRQIEKLAGGKLQRTEPGNSRVFGDVGTGSVTFQKISDKLLKVTVVVEITTGVGTHQESSSATTSLTINLAAAQFWENTAVFDAF